MFDRFIPRLSADPVSLIYGSTVPAFTVPAAESAHISERFQRVIVWRGITENATLLRAGRHTEASVEVAADIMYGDIVGARYGVSHAAVPYAAVSALVIVVTSDDAIILRYRDSGDWPVSYECPGGFVRAATQYRSVDAFITERLQNELTSVVVQSCSCIGLYVFPSIAEHMYVYEAQTTQTSADILAQEPGTYPVPRAALTLYIGGERVPPAPLHLPTARVLAAYHAWYGARLK